MKKKEPFTIRKTKKPDKRRSPKGWDEKRVQAVLDCYDNQSDEEGAAEYEAGMKINGQSMILVPTKLIPEIRKLIASRK